MIADEPAAAGDSRGWIAGGHSRNARKRELVARAFAASSPCFALRSRQGRWPPQRLRIGDAGSLIIRSLILRSWVATGFGKCGTPFERCRAEAVVPPRSGDKGKQETT